MVGDGEPVMVDDGEPFCCFLFDDDVVVVLKALNH